MTISHSGHGLRSVCTDQYMMVSLGVVVSTSADMSESEARYMKPGKRGVWGESMSGRWRVTGWEQKLGQKNKAIEARHYL